MIHSPFKRFVSLTGMLAAGAALVLGISGCGGGGGDGDDNIIAPQSLEQVKISFFGAFDMEFARLGGSAGNENGAFIYTNIKRTFEFANSGPGGSLATTVNLPVLLERGAYQYVRTGLDTGRITLTFSNIQAYPYPEATKDTRRVIGTEMFWGGRNRIATELVVDVLFTDAGGVLGGTSSRIRSAYSYLSEWVGGDTGSAENSEFPYDFDSPDVTFRMNTGRGVATGYTIYNRDGVLDNSQEQMPSSVVWDTLRLKTLFMIGSDKAERTLAYQSVGGAGVPIPGVRFAEESGTILVDAETEGVIGVGGKYSYHRTGGDKAKFAISYVRPGSGTVTIVYDLTFKSFTSGDYMDSQGMSGTFREVLYFPK
jgi:hypothetical protein